MRRERGSPSQLHASLVAAFGKNSIVMPPLSDRRRDIVALARIFLKEVDSEGSYHFSKEAERALATLEYNHHNASQLRESIEIAMLCADDSEIRAEHLFSGASTEEGSSGLDLRRLFRRSRLFRGGPLSLMRFIVLLSFFGVIIICLTAGSTPTGTMANLFIWGVWEPVVFGLFLLAGSVWCTVCPLSTAGRFGQRLASLRLTPPAWLKRNGVWLATIGFFAIIGFEIVFHMGQNPQASGLLLSGLVLASMAFCAVYSREVWCRYVCPLGALASGLAPAAPLEVSARPGLCSSSCTTHDCYKGSSSVSGCSVFHHPLNAAESHQCKLCFDCFKTCPHESTRVLLRPPVVGLWRLSAASAGLAPFAVAVFLLTLVLLAAKNFPWLAEAPILTVAGLGAIGLGALLHRALPYLLFPSSDSAAESRCNPGVAVQVAFALLVLGWGPLMAYQIANIPTIGTLRFAAAAGSFWANVFPSGGLSLDVLVQIFLIVSAAGLSVIALGGTIFLARRKGVGLLGAGWAGLGLLCLLYVAAALFMVF
jgi:polyferredoxin